ncbi:hypothetical protein EMIHUDRAFT_194818 [Emiliania huxleyi CCMP1516]|uniref:Uncharacterized protein n=2 Tax=Emiliania huxleyi TaxID=2903 RepID=A0A0D3L265_EMIH1|nr:hypothetical protein EMIHUDRAFT_194818 [Emiliania huxleyi CCMP1516]EOD42100.1 hypothetical protein EMIHUDRAFT_194818 [Emiliania huxleyi CCMP1516]|eukprot:XP_005794529.1 hypothetical protein EMIHUDRAFT_194818 [Emiliania huxleyi CCMP1516]
MRGVVGSSPHIAGKATSERLRQVLVATSERLRQVLVATSERLRQVLVATSERLRQVLVCVQRLGARRGTGTPKNYYVFE